MEFINRLFDFIPSLGVSVIGLLASYLILRSLWKSIFEEPKAAAYYSAASYIPKEAFPTDHYASIFRFCSIDFSVVVLYYAAEIFFPDIRLLISIIVFLKVALAILSYINYSGLFSQIHSSTIDSWLHEKEPVLPEFALRFLCFPKLIAFLYSSFNILFLFFRFHLVLGG